MSELLEEGSYGCAFTPQIPCKKSEFRKSSKKLVGKVISKEHALIELSMATLVKAIPGWQRYYIVQEEDECSTKNFAKAREEYTNCKMLGKTENKNLTQLISVFGGTTFLRSMIGPTFDYLGTFRHMLEGISKLEEQGICHYDLKENNILVDSKGTLRIIDFGSAFVGDQVNTSNLWLHQYNFAPEYAPQPPELSLQNAIHDGLPIHESIHDIITRKKVFQLIENILGVSVEKSEDELRNFWHDEDENWPLFFKKYWRTWDSWAIGVIFLKLLQKMFLHEYFVKQVWVPYAIVIRNVLKGMLQCNPKNRLTASEALKTLTFSLV